MDTPPEPTPSQNPPVPAVTPTPRSHAFLWTLIFLLVCSLGELGYVLTHTSESAAPSPVVAKPFYLVLDAASGTATSVNDQVLITGSTFPNSTIALYSDNDDAIVESDSRGRFEGSVTVGDTGGTVGVTAYGPAGEELTKIIDYSESVLGKSTTAPGQVKKQTETTTTSAKKSDTSVVPVTAATANKTQEEKLVKDFVANRTPPPKKNALSVSKLKDVISRESTGSGAAISGLKIHKLDVAVVATGAASLSRHAVSGVITAMSGSTVTVSHLIQRDRTWIVLVNAQTQITGKDTASGSATLAVGMRIAAVGQPTNDGLLAQRIHIIPGKAIGVFNRFPVASGSGESSPSATPAETATPSATPTPEI